MKIREQLSKLNFEKISFNVFIALSILFVSSILFNFMNILPEWINLKFVFVGFVIGGVWFLVEKIKKIPEEKRDNNPLIYISQYLFLLGLIVIALNQFLKRQIIIDWIFEISVLVIAFGFLTFYSHRNRVEKEIEDEKTKEEDKEKKRKEEFAEKFPRINKIPIFRSIVKWMYKEGWGYSVALIGIGIISFVIKVFFIKFFSLNGDEGLMVYLVEGIKETGLPMFDTGKIFLRGFFSSYISTLFSFIFNQEILYIRLLSIIFSTILIFLIYNILRKIGIKKWICILIILLFSFNPYFFFWSLEGRFYIESIFWVLLFFYLYIIKEEKNYWTIFIIPFFCFQSNFFSIVVYGVMLFSEFCNFLIKKDKKTLFKVILSFIFIILFWQFSNFLETGFMIGIENPNIHGSSLSIGMNSIPKYKSELYFDMNNSIFSYSFGVFSLSIFLVFILDYFNKKKWKIQRIKFLSVLFLASLIEHIFLFYFTGLYEIRYNLLNYSFLFFILILSLNIFYIIYKNKKVTYLLLLSLITLYIFIPIYPTTIGCSEQNKISNLDILNKLINNPDDQEVASIFIGTSVLNYDFFINKLLKSCSSINCTVIVSDDYNTQAYFRKLEKKGLFTIYILEDFLKTGGLSMKYKNNNYSVYSLDQIYIDRLEDLSFNSNRLFLLLKKNRFEDHNSFDNINYVKTHYTLIDKKIDNVGCRYNNNQDGYLLYSN